MPMALTVDAIQGLHVAAEEAEGEQSSSFWSVLFVNLC